VGQVFMRYANPVEYTVTEDQVADLLRDTYAVLGREGYNPSREDVKTWMKLCDVNQDGKVEFQEYEYFVVKSL
jgi:Ca2+-binding EF-hand superfamily protein